MAQIMLWATREVAEKFPHTPKTSTQHISHFPSSQKLHCKMPESGFVYICVREDQAHKTRTTSAATAPTIHSTMASKWFSSKGLSLSFGSRHRESHSKSNSSLSTCSSDSSNPPKDAEKNREEEFRRVFRYFDRDSDGKVSALELRNYFGSIGEYMSHEEAEVVMNDLDTDGDNLLDADDFVKAVTVVNDDDLRKAFEMFEYEKGSGFITPKGLKKMLSRLGDDKSYEECVAMIRVFDIDGNGVLDFQEFYQMMA